MVKKIQELLEETERLERENEVLLQKLHEAKESFDAMKSGSVDALVVEGKKDIKVLTETTADKIYRIVIEKMNEGAVTLNEDGIILYGNVYFADLINLPLQTLIGKNFQDYIDETSIERIKNLFTAGGENALKEEVYLHASAGVKIPVLITANTFLLDSVLALSIIITDLTLQKKNEEELNEKTKQLEEKNKDLIIQIEENERCTLELILANKELRLQNKEKEKRAAELLIANKELEAFNYISSHDLQEPLRKIQTYSNRILQNEHSKLSDKAKEDFKRIQGAAKRMQTLIEDLLSYSHTNVSECILESEDLNLIIQEVKEDLKEIIEKKEAIIETHRFCEVNIIPFQFRQAMLNLISNALKFAADNRPPHIIIKSSIEKGSALESGQVNLPATGLLPEKEYCHIVITDNGIGFDPQYKEQIFGVFKRLHSKDDYEGSGIGLAIVKKIVENHNGFITATGELNKGARFDIYIPTQ